MKALNRRDWSLQALRPERTVATKPKEGLDLINKKESEAELEQLKQMTSDELMTRLEKLLPQMVANFDHQVAARKHRLRKRRAKGKIKDADWLVVVIDWTIECYQRKHPGTTAAAIAEALKTLAESYEAEPE